MDRHKMRIVAGLLMIVFGLALVGLGITALIVKHPIALLLSDEPGSFRAFLLLGAFTGSVVIGGFYLAVAGYAIVTR